MKKIRVAFFGLAHPHVMALYRTVANYPDDFEIIGFAEVPMPSPEPDHYEARRAGMRDKRGVREFADWHDLIAEKPDLAIVNSDNGSREEVCCTLLASGIHVLAEKPMAMTYEAALHMCRVAKEHGIHMLTNWPIAWFPAFRMAKKMLNEGKIGKLLRVTYRSPATWGPFSYSPDGELPPDEVLARSWWYKSENGGGSILDYACYGTVLSTWMFERQAERVSGIAKNFGVTFADVEDYSAMMLDFGDGVGLLEGSWSTYNPGEIPTGPVLYGTDGVIVCDRHTSTVKYYKGRSHKPVPPTEVVDAGLDRQDILLGAHLAQVLRGETEPDEMLSPRLNLAVVAALEAGAISARTGVTVETKRMN
ncbi:MAG: Gfo/Idh/MocA family oxidoreductase [Clostridia bacterium]|nr:Gfo/Idh/MocA family oxidoreductase [Clostridia bacterium]